jgi:peptide/nickel transport system substrate-binding protein
MRTRERTGAAVGRITGGLVACVTAAVALGACGSSSESESDALRANWPGLPTSWEPGSPELVAGYFRVPYENLVDIGSDGAPTPRLATEWTQTADALTLTLREGVAFHDGTPFDAEAAKASLDLVREGATRFSGQLSPIESIDVLGTDRVRLNLAYPAPGLLTTLAGLGTPMVSPKAIADGTLRRQPVGTGPWAFDEEATVANTTLSFERFDEYWDPDEIEIDRVELTGIEDQSAAFNAVRSGEVDLSAAAIDVLEGAEGAGLGVEAYPGLFNTVLFFDRGPGGVFEDVDVRRGLCSAIDQEAFPKLAPGQFVPATQRFGEGEYGHNPEIRGYPYDPAAAEDLLAGAGSPAIEVQAAVFEDNAPLVEGIAAQLREIGVELSLDQVSFARYLSTWNSGKYPIGSGNTDELTPFDWYENWFAQDAPGNPAGVASARLKRAADAAIAAGNSPEAEPLWGEVMKVIDDEALACGHLIVNQHIVFDPDRVEDVRGIPFEPSSVDYRAVRLAG